MIAKDTGPLFIGHISTEYGKIFFGRMWAEEETDEFITECNNRNISIIFNVMESSHGNIGNIKEIWHPIRSVTEQSEELTQYARQVVAQLKTGKNIFVHCLFGWSRTSHALNALMMELGIEKEQSEALVKNSYQVTKTLNINTNHSNILGTHKSYPIPPRKLY